MGVPWWSTFTAGASGLIRGQRTKIPCCQGNAGLEKWVWKSSLLFSIWTASEKGWSSLLFERLLELPSETVWPWASPVAGFSLLTHPPHHLPVCSNVQARHGPGLLGCVSPRVYASLLVPVCWQALAHSGLSEPLSPCGLSCEVSGSIPDPHECSLPFPA